eukprot:349801-Chlamydomonas_euryale.AAC.49
MAACLPGSGCHRPPPAPPAQGCSLTNYTSAVPSHMGGKGSCSFSRCASNHAGASAQAMAAATSRNTVALTVQLLGGGRLPYCLCW